MFILGLTGGIGSGKSTVAKAFRDLGIAVVDADIAAREVVAKGSPALKQIADHFGPHILQADGTLDRAKLRRIIFDNSEEKQWLESLLHPLIERHIRKQLTQATSPYVVFESPLLLETRQHELVDRVLVVDVPEKTQITRASARDNNSEEQIRAIMSTQLPRQERLSRADDIIDNSGSAADTAAQAQQLHLKYLEIAQTK